MRCSDAAPPPGRVRRIGPKALSTIGPGSRVLDVATGRGATAIQLARDFGCDVLGVDYGGAISAAGARQAGAAGLDPRVAFVAGDAEKLPCADASFDAVTCECAFCTFPDRRAAAGELARVLRPGAALGLADLVRRGPLPAGLDDLLAWIAWIACAHPPEKYAGHLAAVGLEVTALEDHDGALADLVRTVRLRLMAADVAAHAAGVTISGADLARARDLARAAERAVADGSLGYMLMVARKPEHSAQAAMLLRARRK